MSETLYSLTDKALELAQYIEDNADQNLEELLKDTIESIELSIDEKLEAILKIRQNKLAAAKAIKEEMERMKKRMDSLNGEAARLEAYLDFEVRRLGHTYKDKKMKKRVVGNWELSIKKKVPTLEIVDSNKIPMNFFVMQPAPAPAVDRKALLDHLKEKAIEHLEATKDPDRKTKVKMDEVDVFDLEDMGIRLVNNQSTLNIK